MSSEGQICSFNFRKLTDPLRDKNFAIHIAVLLEISRDFDKMGGKRLNSDMSSYLHLKLCFLRNSKLQTFHNKTFLQDQFLSNIEDVEHWGIQCEI